uniref:rRNA methyltransferase 3 n=1 Tax=Hirondellea gigas TaxID=1518452 RepID=A0A2P2I059_9CRUS
MVIYRCLKLSSTLWLGKPLLRITTTSSYSSSVAAALHQQECSSRVYSSQQCRGYRKFSRIPIEVRPAKQDAGKILLGDYVDKTSVLENKEVMEETRRIARLTQQASNTASSKSSNFTNATQNQYSEEDELEGIHEELDVKEKKHKNKGGNQQKELQVKKNYAAEYRPGVKAALNSLNPEFFEKAPLVYRQLLQKCHSSKLRDEHDLVMMEGSKLIREVLASGIAPEAVYFSRKKSLLQMMPEHMDLQEKVERLRSYKLFRMSYRKLSAWSSVVKAQGLIGVFKLSAVSCAPRLKMLPASEEDSALARMMSRVSVVLDSVQEPGNVGAIIRTAAAVGATNIALMKGCCDPWEGKALRAGCGGHFSMNITRDVSWNAVYNAVPQYPTVFVADICNSDREPLKPDTEDYNFLDDDDDIADNFDGRRRRNRNSRREQNRNDDDGSEEENNIDGILYEVGEDGKELMFDNSFNDEELLRKYEDVKLPTNNFNDIDFYPLSKVSENRDIVLVIGGETGLSNCAKKFAEDNIGKQVSIPLHNGIDSLNTSVASGVILYQIWNQAQQFVRARINAERDISKDSA